MDGDPHQHSKGTSRWHPAVKVLLALLALFIGAHILGVALRWVGILRSDRDLWPGDKEMLAIVDDLGKISEAFSGYLADYTGLVEHLREPAEEPYVTGKVVLVNQSHGEIPLEDWQRVNWESACKAIKDLTNRLPSGTRHRDRFNDLQRRVPSVSWIMAILPNDLKATKPQEVGTVVLLKWSRELVGGYFPGLAPTDERLRGDPHRLAYVVICDVAVIDARRRTIVGEGKCRGHPREVLMGGDTEPWEVHGPFPARGIVGYLNSFPRRP